MENTDDKLLDRWYELFDEINLKAPDIVNTVSALLEIERELTLREGE